MHARPQCSSVQHLDGVQKFPTFALYDGFICFSKLRQFFNNLSNGIHGLYNLLRLIICYSDHASDSIVLYLMPSEVVGSYIK